VPYGDFFRHGWGQFSQVSSQMVAANPHGGFNSYWPMPFRTGASGFATFRDSMTPAR
jgi:hypothetical protein